jgi:hypothetical protein
MPSILKLARESTFHGDAIPGLDYSGNRMRAGLNHPRGKVKLP